MKFAHERAGLNKRCLTLAAFKGEDCLFIPLDLLQPSCLCTISAGIRENMLESKTPHTHTKSNNKQPCFHGRGHMLSCCEL